jgi:hypothetical protein
MGATLIPLKRLVAGANNLVDCITKKKDIVVGNIKKMCPCQGSLNKESHQSRDSDFVFYHLQIYDG